MKADATSRKCRASNKKVQCTFQKKKMEISKADVRCKVESSHHFTIPGQKLKHF